MILVRIFVFLTTLLYVGATVDTMAQPGDFERVCQISDRGKLKGIFSFRITRFLSSKTSTRLFVAAWYVSDDHSTPLVPERQLVIFEKDGALYKQVFSYEEKDPWNFKSLDPLTL